MKSSQFRLRSIYAAAFGILLLTEILIALFVRDAFIRPYGGDILVTVLLCCFVRIFLSEGVRLLPLWVFLFSAAVEIGQYFDYASILGFTEPGIMRTILGSSFSLADLLCYAAGCILFALAELYLIRKNIIKKRTKE